jgi:MoaA/NifB/PqqE/SkfB family radical SAM enzyme
LSRPLKKYYSELTVSVDGFSAFHEKMRGKVGLFEDVKNSIKLLAQEARLGNNFLVTQEFSPGVRSRRPLLFE